MFMRLRSGKIIRVGDSNPEMANATTANASSTGNVASTVFAPSTSQTGANISSLNSEGTQLATTTIPLTTMPPSFTTGLQTSSMSVPLFGMPQGWNSNTQGVQSSPTMSVIPTVTPIGRSTLGGHNNAEPGSGSTVRQNADQGNPRNRPSIDQIASDPEVQMMRDMLQDVVDRSTRSTANVLAQHLGGVLTPLAQSVGRMAELLENDIRSRTNTNAVVSPANAAVNSGGVHQVLNPNNLPQNMNTASTSHNQVIPILNQNIQPMSVGGVGLVPNNGVQFNDNTGSTAPPNVSQGFDLFAGMLNTRTNHGQVIPNIFQNMSYNQPNDFQNNLLNQANPFGTTYPNPNPNNQVFYQDQQQQVRNLNIERMVEQTLNRHGFNIGFSDKMLFASPFPYEVQAMDMPRGYKIPKFTKFAGELEESTVEHVARFTLECGDLAASELLKMKLFPNSLTKEAFSCFTTLIPNSIRSWIQLERQFHEQFYRGEIRISITDLSSIRRHPNESIDDYLSRFRKLKSRCPTPIPEVELVKMVVKGLDYQVRKKLLDHHIVDMAQLADRVRQVENLYAEKVGHKRITRNQKIAYIDVNEPFEVSEDEVEEEVDLAELKPGPPYVCRALYPSYQKDTNAKTDTWSQKVYGFDISKADLIFDILVKDKQLLLSQDHKLMTSDQLKGRKYCKFHNKIGHTTNSCIRFRDLIQQAIKEGRLKFESPKSPMKVDIDPLPKEANTVEPEMFEINMVNVSAADACHNSRYRLQQFHDFQEEIYPRKGEPLSNFLARKKQEQRAIALCPRCSAVFDFDAAEAYEESEFRKYFNHIAEKHKATVEKRHAHLRNAFQFGQSSRLREEDVPDWYSPPVEGIPQKQRSNATHHMRLSKVCPNHQHAISGTYTKPRDKQRYQWRRIPRDQPKILSHRLKSEVVIPSRPKGTPVDVKGKGKQAVDEEEVDSSKFESGFPDDLQAICNVVSILPLDFSAPVEMVEEEEDFFDEDEGPIIVHDSMPFDADNAAVFPTPTEEMKSHLKPLFVKARADGRTIKRVLVDGGAAINLIPERVVDMLGKTSFDLIPHNIVITDFNGTKSTSPGCVALDLRVGSVTRTTMFVVVPSNANYNLLLGREWIHGVGAVPSTLHQMIILWNQNNQVEIIRGDDNYFRCEVNTADFDRNLCNIEPLKMENKDDFYPEFPAQIQLSPHGLTVEEVFEVQQPSLGSQETGCTVTFYDRESFYRQKCLSDISTSKVIEFNAIGVLPRQNNDIRTHPMIVPRDQVHYPDIRPTGWVMPDDTPESGYHPMLPPRELVSYPDIQPTGWDI